MEFKVIISFVSEINMQSVMKGRKKTNEQRNDQILKKMLCNYRNVPMTCLDMIVRTDASFVV